MTSKLTREERVQSLYDLKIGQVLNQSDIESIKMLARMALAAIDSKPVVWVMLEDLADKDIVSTPAYPDINDAMEMTHGELEPLYRHAQPAPVVPDESYQQLSELYHAQEKRMFKIAQRIKGPAFDKYSHSPSQAIDVLEVAIFGDDESCRTAMLQAQSDDDGEPTDDERIVAIEGIHNCERCSDGGWVIGEMGITRCACGQADNSPAIPGAEQLIADAVDLLKKAAPAMLADNGGPDGPLAGRMKPPVIPEGYVMVPMRLTAENGAKRVLSGEFSETQFVNCPECFGDDECETCDGSGRIEIKAPVSWTTIKEIWIKGVEHFAAAPQENN